MIEPGQQPAAANPAPHQHGAQEAQEAAEGPDAGLGQDGGIITLSQGGGSGLSRFMR
ncbi:hypothetical protein [Thiomonas sp. FB-Cd]|uniref:hypothetical protein n=1 Tax=Thiomonas sp. FB-Cd TaxID=1158292 RepID=UPI000B05CF91|nr:hypothetical protein [Thiomonas sp. FB-Cd]